jgi:hypothetical protein
MRAYQNRPEFYHSKTGHTRKNTILLTKINNAPILKSGIFPSLKRGDFTLFRLGDMIVRKLKIKRLSWFDLPRFPVFTSGQAVPKTRVPGLHR